MKVLYLDCGMGAAGDMLSAALLQLVPDPERILSAVNRLNMDALSVSLEPAEKCGISGAQYRVKIGGEEEADPSHHHHHHHIGEIYAIIDKSGAPKKVREDAKAVYNLLARAESQVHGCEMENIHFHEVGTMDAIVDIMTVCMLLNELKPDRICASEIHVGSGTVRCAHGELPVPAPATALLLRGIPTYSTELRGELCTPTGAALLRYFVNQYGPMPSITADKIAYGMGAKDFPRANCVRAIIGESQSEVVELKCNVDDMSGEAIGYAMEKLMEEGAMDVSWQPAGMKKSRPGTLLTVVCQAESRDRMVRRIFKYTSTIGIRETVCQRYILRRENGCLESSFSPIRVKISSGYGVKREKPEYEDLKKLADELDLSIMDVRKLIESYDRF